MITTELPRIALSIRQPWAWLIVNGHKTIENRSRNIGNFTGPVLIHASKACPLGEYYDVQEFLLKRGLRAQLAALLKDWENILKQTGGIVGMADITGHGNMEMHSPWWTGPYSYILENASVLPFQPCKGQLGFFPCTYEIGRTSVPTSPIISGGAR
jgi:hypothetical protein